MRKGINLIFLIGLLMLSFNFGFVSAQDSSQYVEPLLTVQLECSLEEKAQRISPDLSGSPVHLNPSIVVTEKNRMVMANTANNQLIITLSDDLKTFNSYIVEPSAVEFGLKSITEVILDRRGNDLFLLVLGLRTNNQGRAYVLKSTNHGESFFLVTVLPTLHNALELYFGDIAVLENGTLVFIFSYLFGGVEYCEEHDYFNGSSFVWNRTWYGDGNRVRSQKFQSAGSRLYLARQQEVNSETGEVALIVRYSDDLKVWSSTAGPFNQYLWLYGDLEGYKVHGWMDTAYDSQNRVLYVLYPVRASSGSSYVEYVAKRDGQIWSAPFRLQDVDDSRPGLLPAVAVNNGQTFAVWLDGRNDEGLQAYGVFINQLGKIFQNFPLGEPFELSSYSSDVFGIKMGNVTYGNYFLIVWPQDGALYARLKAF